MKLLIWIGKALSDNGVPSSKRLITFIFALTVCYGVIYVIHRVHNFPQYLYYGLIVMIALLLGVATVPQIMEIWKGKSNPVITDKGKEPEQI